MPDELFQSGSGHQYVGNLHHAVLPGYPDYSCSLCFSGTVKCNCIMTFLEHGRGCCGVLHHRLIVTKDRRRAIRWNTHHPELVTNTFNHINVFGSTTGLAPCLQRQTHRYASASSPYSQHGLHRQRTSLRLRYLVLPARCAESPLPHPERIRTSRLWCLRYANS